jgi:hypothetical protein
MTDHAALRKLAVASTIGPWHPGHLCKDDSSCNCRYIFGGDDKMGAIASVHVDDGENDCPPAEEAKANQRYLAAISPNVMISLLDEREQLHEAIRCVLGADLPKYLRTLVAGWNGEDHPVGERFGRHPVTLGATIPTTCGAVYELDEAVRCLEALISAEKVRSALNPQGQGEGK